MSKMVVILDYGMGNTASILNMLQKIGGSACISMDKAVIEAASGIILPGVGAFDNGMQKLKASGVLDIIEKKVHLEKKPFLGVCLGMHLLFEQSEEGSEHGLGWLAGTVKRFDFSALADNKRLKVPHMGWNTVNPREHSALFKGLEENNRFYFVHSYHVECTNSSNSLATTTHGYELVSAIQKDNILGVQFHPEKSHRFGMTLLKNFMDQVEC